MVDTQVAEVLPGSLVDGRYRVRGQVDRDHLTSVYTATDERLERTVALKMVNPTRSGAPQFVDRFVEEATAIAQLAHPNAVAVYDQGIHQGLPYVVMEHVEGRTLREILAARRRLTPVEALAIIEQMLAALAAAHRAGQAHRDVKPENVLIAAAPSGGTTNLVDSVVKLADFGLAQAVRASTAGTEGGQLTAAASYASPELVADGRADQRSDVYSTGIVLFELLTGRVPYDEGTPAEVAWQHVDRDVPAPSAYAAGLSGALDNLVTWATRRDPGGRPTDAGALLAEVQRVREEVTSAGVRPRPADATVVMRAVPPADRPTWARLPSARPRTGAEQRAGEPHGSGTLVTAGTESRSGGDGGDRAATRRLWVAGVAALVGFGLLMAIGGWWLGVGRWMPAPDLRGLTEAEAVARADRDGLRVELADPAHDAEVPAGQVLAQDPRHEGRIVKGGTITLTVSLGPGIFPVPDVIGAELEVAERQLAELGVVVEQAAGEFSDTVPEGRVAAVSPEVGTEVRQGETVTISISKGKAPISVPLLEGDPLPLAEHKLRSAGLQVVVEYVDSDRPKDEVVGQDPDYGSGVEPGDTVTVEVSNGPPTVPVPDVENMRCEDGVRVLQEAGFEVRVAGDDGKVRRQNPSGGTGLPPGAEVGILCR